MDQKSEIAPVTTIMIEGITRRDFIKLGIGVVSSGIFGRKSVVPEMVRAQELSSNEVSDNEVLRKEIENRHNVRFSLREDMQFSWEGAYLQNMDAFLTNMPEHFYVPDEHGRVVNFELNNTESNYCCGYRDEDIKVAVTILGVYLEEAVSRNVGHELTHRVAEVPIFHENGDVSFENPNQFEQKVENIIGMSLKDNISLLEHFKFSTDQIQTGDDHRLKNFLQAYEYGIGASGEFIPVMSEEFVLGKEHFRRMYGMLFPDQVEELYEFMKDEIFRGKHFEDMSLPDKMKEYKEQNYPIK